MENKTNLENRTDRTDETDQSWILFKHGGYRNLKSFQSATLIFDLTVEFFGRYIDFRSRTKDQMEQAARSGRQNIAEGSRAAGTSKKTEIKLTNVARASLEELLLDYEDFLRQRGLRLWTKEDHRVKAIRSLAYDEEKSDKPYQSYLSEPESAANMIICLIHQTNYLLDQQIRKLSEDFLNQGGFSERLYWKRKNLKNNN